jgi:hypothetical protein
MKKLQLLIGLFLFAPTILLGQKIKVGIAGMTHGHVGQA